MISFHNFRSLLACMLCLLLLVGCAGTPVPTETTAAAETVAELTPIAEEAPEETSIPEGSVVVSNVTELLAAIDSDTTIFLLPGLYDLSIAPDYGGQNTAHYRWDQVYDGCELVVTDVRNLTITAAFANNVTLAAEPRYANVLTFAGCENITLNSVTVGHTTEPGYCSGGVLNFAGTDNVSVNSCRLYGCGIRGIDATQCRDLHVVNTEIYECTYGAVFLQSCSDVLFEDCSFHDIAFYTLFEVINCDTASFINSEIYNNQGDLYSECFNNSGSRVYYGGLDLHNNHAETLFAGFSEMVIWEGNRFTGSYSDFCRDAAPKNRDLEALTEADVLKMDLERSCWDGTAFFPMPEAPQTPEPDESGWIHVSTVDAFLAAIGPNTNIFLEPGTYDLSTAANYGGRGSQYYSWEENYDGPELLISNVTGLHITGSGADKTTIAAIPRYANVLHFENCSDLYLSDFTAGHTQEPGNCSGGVLLFDNVSKTNIVNCGLYGCGIVGIWANSCSGMNVFGTEIYHCSDGACWFWNCDDVELIQCNIHDIDSRLFSVQSCRNMYINGAILMDSPYA